MFVVLALMHVVVRLTMVSLVHPQNNIVVGVEGAFAIQMRHVVETRDVVRPSSLAVMMAVVNSVARSFSF